MSASVGGWWRHPAYSASNHGGYAYSAINTYLGWLASGWLRLLSASGGYRGPRYPKLLNHPLMATCVYIVSMRQYRGYKCGCRRLRGAAGGSVRRNRLALRDNLADNLA